MKVSDTYSALISANKYSMMNYLPKEKNFAEKLREISNTDSLEISSLNGANAVNTKDMSIGEYKAYIYDKINSMPMSLSRSNDFIAVQISEDGFAAMKSDPEYEKWVLDTVSADFSRNDPLAYTRGIFCEIKHFGAVKEDYGCETWCIRDRRAEKEYEEKTKKCFWEIRRKRQKMYAELAEKHRLQQKELEEAVLAEQLMREENIYSKKAPRFTFSAARDVFSHMDMFF